MFYSSLYTVPIFSSGSVKKYNLAISVFFGNLNVKQFALLISLRINSLYSLFVVKKLPQISAGCFLSSVVEIT